MPKPSEPSTSTADAQLELEHLLADLRSIIARLVVHGLCTSPWYVGDFHPDRCPDGEDPWECTVFIRDDGAIAVGTDMAEGPPPSR